MRRGLLGLALAVVLACSGRAAVAAAPIVPNGWEVSDIDPAGLSGTERAVLQDALMWVGAYTGARSGEWSPATAASMRAWRSTRGFAAGSRLSRAELLTLLVLANQARAEAAWTASKDPATGFWFAWPARDAKPPMPARSEDGAGSDYEPRGASGMKIMTRVTTTDPRRLIEALLRPGAAGSIGPVRVTFRLDGADRQMATLVTAAGVTIFVRYDRVGAEWRGFSVFGQSAAASMWLIGPMSADFTASAEPALPALDRSNAPVLGEVAALAAKPEWAQLAGQAGASKPGANLGLRATGSGTAFVIRRDGSMLTNAHVVNGCDRLALADGTEATLVAADPARDLALVRAAHGFGSALSFRRDETIEHGEPVRVFGFPYFRLVSESLNITDGIVTSLSGPRGNMVQFQMSANLQPGNSGGPVLDEAGDVIGVSVAELNSLAIARLTGVLPQGMNYAVRGSEAEAFLAEHGVTVAKAADRATRDLRAIAKLTTPLVFPLICYN